MPPEHAAGASLIQGADLTPNSSRILSPTNLQRQAITPVANDHPGPFVFIARELLAGQQDLPFRYVEAAEREATDRPGVERGSGGASRLVITRQLSCRSS